MEPSIDSGASLRRGVRESAPTLNVRLSDADAIPFPTRTVERGDALYCAGEPLRSLYTVQSGCFKTVATYPSTDDDSAPHTQVTGFHFANETLGLDGVCTSRHESDAVALETSVVRIMPVGILEPLCREYAAMQHELLAIMSAEIVRASRLALLLGTMPARERVAAFLLDFSERLEAGAASELLLPMTRADIGSYLGLELETVSRMLSKLQREGAIGLNGRQVRIVDRAMLAHH
ncbi:Crp/Fnr family transcriptional regulator [Burkholderia sp. SFA1]|uniref:helix-turn-helix domain-containing protein n=1 Tax=unclassified Caballeronia TaxID=2646786 RepID=UPI001F1D903F|nr:MULTISPECIES: helix-turn-helix domain-containing protein [unclassified Caballeronia]MCE4544482.1 helix-turn-helix domain-containing protein [Caballeronia sp. PC1]MCE4571634.1 helix-turn-helix domain-containing protein [Caballeronia sp. CLC5]BBP98452.1 Crp/Fnr family transcriptional regulator [Burkholderia sp. SFA1]